MAAAKGSVHRESGIDDLDAFEDSQVLAMQNSTINRQRIDRAICIALSSVQPERKRVTSNAIKKTEEDMP